MGEVFVIKGIKPAKLKVRQIRQEILNELRKEGTDQKRELRKTIKEWQGEKPDFESLVSLTRPPGGAMVLTGPTGSDMAVNKWTWLDQGTRPHMITARRRPTLAFRYGGFKPKTKVGRFESSSGQAATGPWVYPRQVRHPGTQARNWSEKLSKQRKNKFRDRMIRAMQRVSAKAF